MTPSDDADLRALRMARQLIVDLYGTAAVHPQAGALDLMVALLQPACAPAHPVLDRAGDRRRQASPRPWRINGAIC